MKHIGLDVGNGSTCIFVRTEDGSTLSAMYPSTYGVFDPEKIQSVLGLKTSQNKMPDVFTLNQRRYVLGYSAVRAVGSEPFSTYGREERIQLEAFRTLTKLALLDAATLDGCTGVIEVSLGFGVPNEDYREDKLQRISEWFSEPITGAKNGQQVVVMVKELEFLSQPIAVLVDAYNDTDGYVQDASIENENILVIDSGSGTLDMTEFRGTRLQKQVSEAIGMNDVYQIVLEDIERREPKVRVDPYDLEYQIRNQAGKRELVYNYGTLSVPITDIYRKAFDDTWETMVGRIERRYPDRTRFHRVLLAGGTGDAFYERFTQWMPQIQKMPDPQLSIARGLCKYIVALSSASSTETAVAGGLVD
ncbi:MAG: recombinase [Alicyclobacillus sp.]|nr:recombinase [Alicyclobacillus sp.]